MKQPYRFIGSHGQIFDTPYVFTQFGQLVSIEPDLAATHRFLVPASKFDAVGFTVDELKKYGDVATHAKAPASFLEKKTRAIALLTVVPDGPVPEPAPTVVVEEGTTDEVKVEDHIAN